jgi:predicted transglutaminase-like cysteine proteinase
MHLHKLSVRVSSAALILLAAAAAPAAAADPASPSNEASVANSAPAHATQSAPAEPKKICRTIETTGSRLKTTKVCLTREQWRDAKYH